MKNKVGDIIELDVHGTECCDICQEIINNQIDYPICGELGCETGEHQDIHDVYKLTCQNCGSVFERINKNNNYWYDGCDVKMIKKGSLCL